MKSIKQELKEEVVAIERDNLKKGKFMEDGSLEIV